MTPDIQTEKKPWGAMPIILVGLAALALLACFAVVILMIAPIDKHFPPESREITAKRLVPDNGFYTLERATQQMREANFYQPIFIDEIAKFGLPPDPENAEEVVAYFEAARGVRMEFEKQFHSLPTPAGAMIHPSGDIMQLLSDTTDTAPLIAKLREFNEDVEENLVIFFDKAAPAITTMRQGLEAEYYLLPEIGDMSMELPYLSQWRSTARTITAQAKWYETQGRYDEAMQNYLDTARLGMFAGSDGPLINGLVGVAITQIGLESLNNSLHKYDDPDLLRQALDTLREIADREAPLRKIFEFEFRLMDNTDFSDTEYYGLWDLELMDPDVFGMGVPFVEDLVSDVNRFKVRTDMLRFKRNIGEYWDQYLDAVDSPISELEKLAPSLPGDPISQLLLPALERAPVAFARRRAMLSGTAIAIALRIYRLERGNYPASLDPLVPEYLGSLPVDPFTGKPFHYEQAGDDFRLYSYYYNQIDDYGAPISGLNGDIVVHLPPDELPAWWAAR